MYRLMGALIVLSAVYAVPLTAQEAMGEAEVMAEGMDDAMGVKTMGLQDEAVSEADLAMMQEVNAGAGTTGKNPVYMPLIAREDMPADDALFGEDGMPTLESDNTDTDSGLEVNNLMPSHAPEKASMHNVLNKHWVMVSAAPSIAASPKKSKDGVTKSKQGHDQTWLRKLLEALFLS